ncbi:hypothetical protein NQZ68_034903 [Dissostichus eleginoides]|nr:hypothetical protein NQZ68_034903 [Dissostichus eleginoides]
MAGYKEPHHAGVTKAIQGRIGIKLSPAGSSWLGINMHHHSLSALDFISQVCLCDGKYLSRRGLQTELLVTGTPLSERDERSPCSAEDWAAVLHALHIRKTRQTGMDTDSKRLHTHRERFCQWP